MRIGVDYYPEHWDRTWWERDADAMAEAGVTTVRMAEFAWSLLEPEEGIYDFSWLDEAVDLFEERALRLCFAHPRTHRRSGFMRSTRNASRWVKADIRSELASGGTVV